ncbi:hypothetical protein Tco_0784430 [Tanacetum coccineum]
MQKAKRNIRKINFKRVVAQKFREYDQKQEALINCNVSEAFEKVVQARILTEIKKLLPTHILAALANYKLKAIIQKDELTIADLEGTGLERLKKQYHNDVKLKYHLDQPKAVMLSKAKWNSDEDDVSKPRSFERHMSKNTKPHPSFYNNNFYYLVNLSTEEKYTTYITNHYASRYYKQGIEDMIPQRWCKKSHSYIFEALNGIHHWEDSRIYFFKAKMIRRSDDQEYEFSYGDLPRLSLNDVKDMYFLQVQDKLHHLPLEFVKYLNNALLIFIKRVVIQNRVEDNQLGVESYQQALNLTKPKLFFKGIDQRIPFIMTTMHKWVVYLNQHNIKSLMRLSDVKIM